MSHHMHLTNVTAQLSPSCVLSLSFTSGHFVRGSSNYKLWTIPDHCTFWAESLVLPCSMEK